MNIFSEVKSLVKKEKFYTSKILNKLMIIERDKLYCDLKYSSLHRYLQDELAYTEGEATVRVNAVRLMLKSKQAKEKLENGKLSLTNAGEAGKIIKKIRDPKKIEEVVEAASKKSLRQSGMHSPTRCREAARRRI